MKVNYVTYIMNKEARKKILKIHLRAIILDYVSDLYIILKRKFFNYIYIERFL